MHRESSTASPECSILIVDDDRPLTDVYAKILKDENHRVATAYSHSEAIEWLKHNPLPDVILLDCRMGEMSNEEFKSALDEIIGSERKVRVIGFSSFSSKSSFADKMRSLFGEFLEKPDDLDHLVILIQNICTEARQ